MTTLTRLRGTSNTAQMNLSTKQKQSPGHREQACGCRERAVGEGCGRAGPADANYHTQDGNQQGPAARHREAESGSCHKPEWKRR